MCKTKFLWRHSHNCSLCKRNGTCLYSITSIACLYVWPVIYSEKQNHFIAGCTQLFEISVHISHKCSIRISKSHGQGHACQSAPFMFMLYFHSTIHGGLEVRWGLQNLYWIRRSTHDLVIQFSACWVDYTITWYGFKILKVWNVRFFPSFPYFLQ